MVADAWMKKISKAIFPSLLLVLLALSGLPACVSELEEPFQEPGAEQESNTEQESATDQAPDTEQETGTEQAPDTEQETGTEQAPGAQNLDPEQAFPTGSGSISEVTFAGRTIEVEEINGKFVYQGDIILHPDMVITEPVELVIEPGEEVVFESVDEDDPSVYSLTARTQAHWPDGVVHYSIDPALTNPERVTDAIAHWEANTNLTFEERTTEADYLYFQPANGCSSYIGKIGGRQAVWLSSACSTGNTIHEIGHAIGLWHEHSRVDRDASVIINWDNIQAGREHNFRTYQEQGYDGDEHTDALDFGSIMMYGSYSFSSNGQPTIVDLNGDNFSIQRSGLSDGDISGINTMYPAGGGEPEYVNGEYYTVAGLTVYRMNEKWYYYTRSYGWKQVRLSSYGYWYYV